MAGPAHKVERIFRVDGMDCGSCAATLTRAMTGLPGVEQVQVSVARQRMTLRHDPDATATATLEQTVRSLGFVATLQDGPAPAPAAPDLHGHDHTGTDGTAPRATPLLRALWAMPRTRQLGASLALGGVALAGAALAPGLEPLLLSGAVLLALAPIARRALAAARLGAVFTIQMLMTIAALGAIVIGEQMEALLVVVLFLLGEVLEGLAAERARSGIRALGALLPRDAWRLDGDTPRKVAADSLRPGQTVLVRPGDRIPADGQIVAGLAGIDESPVTGESVPVTRGPGDRVLAGTVAHDAALQVRVSSAAQDNTIARIIAMVEQAQDAKAPTERFIQRFSRVYMPLVVALAVLVAIVPPLAGLGGWDTWTYRALALLLIGCPCALVISVPAAIAASLAAGARHGILMKGGAVIEDIARAGTVVFDKTGTLTEGKPEVTDLVPLGRDDRALLALVAGVEQGSSHPLAEAICREAAARAVAPRPATEIRVVPGKGMQGRVDGATVFVGAPRFAAERAALDGALRARIDALEAMGKTVAVVIRDSEVAGLIALRDEPRATTRAGLDALRDLGLTTMMLTGDNRRTAEAIGATLGIAVEAELLPQDKAARLRDLGRTQGAMMVGDGVNDAPALAEARVGIAIGSGTDVAMEAADAALMRNDIADVARMTRLARATMANIRQNLGLALGLKAVFLVTTVTGVSGLWMAVLADTGATVLVTLNALRLLGYLGPLGAVPGQSPAPLPGRTGARRGAETLL